MTAAEPSDDPFGLGDARHGKLERVLGIDPGIEGAVGLLAVQGWGVLAVRKLPTLHSDLLGRRIIDQPSLTQLVRELAPSLVVLEKVQPVPEGGRDDDSAAARVTTAGGAAAPAKKRHHMGTLGAFHYGWTCGQIFDAVRNAGHRPLLVAPTSWKSAAGLLGRGEDYAGRKRMSLALARQLWPGVGIANDGCAEALLLARFGFSSQMRFF